MMLHPAGVHRLEIERETGHELRWYALGVISRSLLVGRTDVTIVTGAVPSIPRRRIGGAPGDPVTADQPRPRGRRR